MDSIAVQKAIDYMSESFVEQMTEAVGSIVIVLCIDGSSMPYIERALIVH